MCIKKIEQNNAMFTITVQFDKVSLYEKSLAL